MSRFSDPNYLKNEQYKNSSNLSARIRLHELFSVIDYDFHNWLFDLILIDFPANARILEVGCGTGSIWVKNVDRVPSGWDITLTDLSGGMLDDARHNLGEAAAQFKFQEADAQDIPFEDNVFSGVIANAMLYHVPDRTQAVSELKRVLKPDGSFHAVTMGKDHMLEGYQLIQAVLPDHQFDSPTPQNGFDLDNALTELEQYFNDVKLLRYPSHLAITQAQPYIDYLRSMMTLELSSESIQIVEDHIHHLIDRDGMIRIRKDVGVLVGRDE